MTPPIEQRMADLLSAMMAGGRGPVTTTDGAPMTTADVVSVLWRMSERDNSQADHWQRVGDVIEAWLGGPTAYARDKGCQAHDEIVCPARNPSEGRLRAGLEAMLGAGSGEWNAEQIEAHRARWGA